MAIVKACSLLDNGRRYQSNVRAYSYLIAFVRASVLSFVQTVPTAIVDPVLPMLCP